MENQKEVKSWNTPVEVTCSECGAKFIISRSGYNARMREDNGNPFFRCKECNKKWRAEKMRQRMAEMDPEKKKEMYKDIGKKHAQWINSLDDDAKKEMMIKVNAGRDAWLENVSDEEKERISKVHSESNKRRWANMSTAEKNEYIQQRKEAWANKSDEEKAAHAQYTKDMWANKSEEEYKLTISRMSKFKRGWWRNISGISRERMANKIANTVKKNWENMSEEERIEISKAHQNYWNNLDEEERKRLAKMRLANMKYNKLNVHFEETFRSSSISKDFYNKPEKKTINDSFDHTWDYIIYDRRTNTPVMLVDLDGAFVHANNCDYDGTFAKEEYDEDRYLAIPNNMKSIIISEFSFDDEFSLLEKYLYMTYEEYIEYKYSRLSVISFPYNNYPVLKLLKTYRSLDRLDPRNKYCKDISINTRAGDMLINNFHHSIWHDYKVGNASPYEYWANKEILSELNRDNIIFYTWFNKDKLLQGFNNIKVSVFSAGRAKMIISRYLSEYDTIFDPFSGYSGRMLGTISLGKRYIGQDLSERHVRESNEMISFLHKYGIEFDAEVTQRNILESSGSYPCLFTCPPYGDEVYEDVPMDTRSCDDWIDECLHRFQCKRSVFVVNPTQKYQEYVVETIENKSIFGIPKEYLIVIDR